MRDGGRRTAGARQAELNPAESWRSQVGLLELRQAGTHGFAGVSLYTGEPGRIPSRWALRPARAVNPPPLVLTLDEWRAASDLFGPEVIDRLHWMTRVLGPILSQAVRSTGASIRLIQDGDVAGIIHTTDPDTTGMDLPAELGGSARCSGTADRGAISPTRSGKDC